MYFDELDKQDPQPRGAGTNATFKEPSGAFKESWDAAVDLMQRITEESGRSNAQTLDRMGIDSVEFVDHVLVGFAQMLVAHNVQPSVVTAMMDDPAVPRALMDIAHALLIIGIYHERLGHAAELGT